MQAPLTAGPAGAGYLGPGPAAITDTQPGAGDRPCQEGAPGKLCLLTAAAADRGSHCMSHLLPVLRARQGPGAGGGGAVGVWGGRLGAAAALPSSTSLEHSSCLSCLSSPTFLCSNEEQQCFTPTPAHPWVHSHRAPPAALQPWAALTMGTYHSSSRNCEGPPCIPVNPSSHKEAWHRENTKAISSGSRLGVPVSLLPAYKNFACSWLFSHHF